MAMHPARVSERKLSVDTSSDKTDTRRSSLALLQPTAPTAPHMPPAARLSVSRLQAKRSEVQLWEFDPEKQYRFHNPSQQDLTKPEELEACVVEQQELDRLASLHPLPTKKYGSCTRFLRWNFFSVYRKLFSIVLLINLANMVIFLFTTFYPKKRPRRSYETAATAASANFCAAILFRNEHVINFLFETICTIARPMPMCIKRHLAKIYSYGGMHSGCGIAGTMWYIIFCAMLVDQYTSSGANQTALAATTGLTLMLFALILIFAHPKMRARMHNQFEATHRFAGWAAIACLWAQTLVLVKTGSDDQHISFGMQVIRTPSFWFLTIITCLIIYPWTRLRLRRVQTEVLSQHAVRLHFDYTNLRSCEGIRLTDSPLQETHSFACIPYNPRDGRKGFSVIVSKAGDWTKKIIDNPPSHIYVKGAPVLGMMRIALVFKKVLVVTTGSGIGPCLSILNVYPEFPVRVLWSARKPFETYGSEVVRAVYGADPNAVMVDSKKTGRGNVVALAYSMYKESGSEAVVVMSNPAVTKKVVYGLEARGVPAFGPIFDS